MMKIEFIVICIMLSNCSYSQPIGENSDTNNKIDTIRNDSIANGLYKEAMALFASEKTEEDYQKIYTLLKKSANMGNVDALSFLGCQLLNGRTFKINEKLGMQYVAKAIENNSSDAIVCLAYFKYDQEEISSYIELLKQADKLGNISATIELGYFFVDGSSFYHSSYEDKVKRQYIDIKQGVKYLEKASEEGSLIAKFKLALLLLEGNSGNIKPDTLRAKRLLQECIGDQNFPMYDQADQILNKISN